MKILLLGKNGQVGWELQRALAPLGTVVALGRTPEQHLCGDLSNSTGLANTLRTLAPDIIVNAAAYTAVDQAEQEPDQAHAINVNGPTVLAQEAARLGARLIHYSTDYVFDGTGEQAWRETDRTHPLSVYGRTKLEGEQAIVATGCQHIILRTSWVYAGRGKNFATTILRLARERTSLSIINDQWGAPTGADLIADVTAHIIAQIRQTPTQSGLYHLVASGTTSWHAYACYVLQKAAEAGVKLSVQADAITPISAAFYPVAAPRPLNSRLDTSLLRQAFGLTLPPWQQGVSRLLTETLAQ
jgi:dTDP-4-dehydrorhamnose reductase